MDESKEDKVCMTHAQLKLIGEGYETEVVASLVELLLESQRELKRARQKPITVHAQAPVDVEKPKARMWWVRWECHSSETLPNCIEPGIEWWFERINDQRSRLWAIVYAVDERSCLRVVNEGGWPSCRHIYSHRAKDQAWRPDNAAFPRGSHEMRRRTSAT
jgi:hypothetical protein